MSTQTRAKQASRYLWRPMRRGSRRQETARSILEPSQIDVMISQLAAFPLPSSSALVSYECSRSSNAVFLSSGTHISLDLMKYKETPFSCPSRFSPKLAGRVVESFQASLMPETNKACVFTNGLSSMHSSVATSENVRLDRSEPPIK